MYQIDTGYFCAGVIVQGGYIVRAAPILKWAVGQRWIMVAAWADSKGALITELPGQNGV